MWLRELKGWTYINIDNENSEDLSKYKLSDENYKDFSKNKLTEFIENSGVALDVFEIIGYLWVSLGCFGCL